MIVELFAVAYYRAKMKEHLERAIDEDNTEVILFLMNALMEPSKKRRK